MFTAKISNASGQFLAFVYTYGGDYTDGLHYVGLFSADQPLTTQGPYRRAEAAREQAVALVIKLSNAVGAGAQVDAQDKDRCPDCKQYDGH